MPTFAAVPHAEPGAWARFTRLDVDPKHSDEAITAYEDLALPWFQDAPGSSRALLLYHQRSARAITESVWRDEASLAASRGADATARADTTAAADAAVRALEEYRLLFSSMRGGT